MYVPYTYNTLHKHTKYVLFAGGVLNKRASICMLFNGVLVLWALLFWLNLHLDYENNWLLVARLYVSLTLAIIKNVLQFPKYHLLRKISTAYFPFILFIVIFCALDLVRDYAAKKERIWFHMIYAWKLFHCCCENPTIFFHHFHHQ